MWYGVKRIKSIFADKWNSGTRFGALFITSSYCCHFFNKTDLEQYLFIKYIKNLGMRYHRFALLRVASCVYTMNNFTLFDLS